MNRMPAENAGIVRFSGPGRIVARAGEFCYIRTVITKEVDFMEELIITCSPDNLASKKTLQKLGGQLLETVEVPADHWLYQRGETVKDIYRFLL